jgi:metal-responsive CopG/Arc/MetJ family transcriptional regulator
MRTTVVIPDELKKRARRVAAERGVSMSELIREALEEKVNASPRKLRFIGIASVGGDLGRRSGDEPAIPEPWR